MHDDISVRLTNLSTEQRDYYLEHFAEHFIKASKWKKLEYILTNLEFIEAKCRAGKSLDFINDCDKAKDAYPLPSVSQIRSVFSSIIQYISIRPELLIQLLYNHLIWLQSLEPCVQDAIKSAMRTLIRRQYWVRAEGPLPSSTPSSIPFNIQSSIQSFTTETGILVIASRNGNIELRQMPYGKLIETRKIKFEDIVAITLCSDNQRLAFAVESGIVRLEGIRYTLPGRQGESILSYIPSKGVVAVREDNSLVIWQAEKNYITVLAPNIPTPLTTLQVDPKGNWIFFVAGRDVQLLGLCQWSGEKWEFSDISYSGPFVVDAKMDSKAEHLLIASQDRQLKMLDILSGNVSTHIAYEAQAEEVLRGAPLNCAFGEAASDGWAFLTTRNGQIGAWNWKQSFIKRLEDYHSTITQIRPCHFETLKQSGELLLTFPDHSILMSLESHNRSRRQSLEALNGCAITSTGVIVSISSRSRSIHWHSLNGLELQAQQTTNYVPPTAVAPTNEEAIALVGTDQGLVWKQPPDILIPRYEIDQVFAEPVVSLFSNSDGSAIIASRSGRVVRHNFITDKTDVLWKAGEANDQHKVMPAGSLGLYWSFYVDKGKGGNVLSLITAPNQGKIMWESHKRISDAAVNSDGTLLCFAGKEVEVWQLYGDKLIRIYHRNESAQYASFLSANRFLAIILLNKPWLEIWSLTDNLPTLASHYLPSKATCISTFDNAIAVGFETGELMSLSLFQNDPK